MTSLAASLAFVSLVLGSTPLRAAAAACPQTPPVYGLLAGSPLGFTSLLEPNIQVKLAGFLPVSAPAPSRPNFEALVPHLLQSLGLDQMPGEPPILAMSLGIDVILAKRQTLQPATDQLDDVAAPANLPVAVLEVASANHGWYAIEFSVDKPFLDNPQDAAPDVAEADLAGEVERSVFTYLLPESKKALELLPNEENTVRSLLPANLGLDAGDDLHALNLHMGLYDTDLVKHAGTFTMRALPPAPKVYFTLRPEFAKGIETTVANHWGGGTGDASTIYVVQWHGNHWTGPVLYCTAQSLGLEHGGTVEPPILDGLAIDTMNPDAGGDSIMFSLRPTIGRPVPAEAQIQMAVKAADGGTSEPPRRVVVRKIGTGYRSLGKAMKAGRGIGDFCTGDPWARREATALDFTKMFFLDDFFVARRLPNDDPKSGMLALAIAAYRQGPVKPFARVCLSWPGGGPGPADVVAYTGTTDDITAQPPVYTWNPQPLKMQYLGKPIQFDVALPVPSNGVLPQPPPAPSTPHAATPHPPCAFVIKWQLNDHGKTLISPVAALRY